MSEADKFNGEVDRVRIDTDTGQREGYLDGVLGVISLDVHRKHRGNKEFMVGYRCGRALAEVMQAR